MAWPEGPLVTGCSIDHVPLHLHVSRWNMRHQITFPKDGSDDFKQFPSHWCLFTCSCFQSVWFYLVREWNVKIEQIFWLHFCRVGGGGDWRPSAIHVSGCDLMAALLFFLFLHQTVNLTVTNDVLLKCQTTAWEKFPKMEASFTHPHPHSWLISKPKS